MANGPVTGLDPDGLWYIDVNITLGVVTFGIQYGYDPHASSGPVSVWHPSTWSNSKMWHPYVGPAIGLGGSVQYAPDKKDPFTGTVTPTSPSTGWQRQAAIGIPLAGKWGGIGLAGGNPLNPRKPWYKGLFDPCPPTFAEVGYATPGGSFSAYYVW